MGMVFAVVAVASAVVIAGLVYAVTNLRADVQRLQDQLNASRPERPVTIAVPLVPQGNTDAAAGRADLVPTEPVPVITHLDDHRYADGLDITKAMVASVTLARPLIKVAAFSHGLRRALDDEQRMRIRWAMRKEFRSQRKMRRRRRAGRAPSEGWRP